MARVLRGLARFWIDLVVGDDWIVAAIIAAALLGSWALAHAGLPAWWLLPSALVLASLLALRRAIARDRLRPGQQGCDPATHSDGEGGAEPAGAGRP